MLGYYPSYMGIGWTKWGCSLGYELNAVAFGTLGGGDYTYINKPPNHQYYLGTDQNGRDQLSRMIFGTRATLILSLIAVGAGPAVAMFFDGIRAYACGKVDVIQ